MVLFRAARIARQRTGEDQHAAHPEAMQAAECSYHEGKEIDAGKRHGLMLAIPGKGRTSSG